MLQTTTQAASLPIFRHTHPTDDCFIATITAEYRDSIVHEQRRYELWYSPEFNQLILRWGHEAIDHVAFDVTGPEKQLLRLLPHCVPNYRSLMSAFSVAVKIARERGL